MKMNAFISWSGGKDCSLALYLFLKNPEHRIISLVNIEDSSCMNGHNVEKSLLLAQSKALNIPLISVTIPEGQTYEFKLKAIISELKNEGVNSGVFGDICLSEHRIWIERICKEMGIEAVFPLWGRSTKEIMKYFSTGVIKALIVSVRDITDLRQFIGKELDESFIEELSSIEGLNICGECGEYHTFVVDSPLYNKPIPIVKKDPYIDNAMVFIPIELKNNNEA